MAKSLIVAILTWGAVAGFIHAGDLPVPSPATSPPQNCSSTLLAAPCAVLPESQLLAEYRAPIAALNGAGYPNYWVNAETLLWWTKNGQSPDLVTTGVPGLLPGVLGQPGTSVLVGGSNTNNPLRVGGRFGAGMWLDSLQMGIEGNYFFLPIHTQNYDSNASLIARPFFDVLTGLQNAQLVAFPGLANGEIHIDSSSRLQGSEINLSGQFNAPNNLYNASYLVGFRYLQLDESLNIRESSRISPILPAAAPLFGGSTITVADRFETRNYFYGPQIGARGEVSWGRLFINARGKVALGVTHQVANISGSTTITSPNGTVTNIPVGFLASGTNSGQFTQDRFTVVPEAGINLGMQLTGNMRAYMGYTFLYWSSVLRPGDQIDVGLSGNQIPTDGRFNPGAGPARPGPTLKDTDYWAQGVNFGLEFIY